MVFFSVGMTKEAKMISVEIITSNSINEKLCFFNIANGVMTVNLNWKRVVFSIEIFSKLTSSIL